MTRSGLAIAAVLALGAIGGGSAGGTVNGPPQGTQSDAAFAASYSAMHVTNVSATTQRTSCYKPETFYAGALPASAGYPGGGSTNCPAVAPAGAPMTGENQGPFDTQDAVGTANPSLLVKDHSESDIRVDPANPNHLIGQSKWFVNAEGYNHLLGFYESWDGGATWPVQGHVPGYEGWTDNTDPVGAFDPTATSTRSSSVTTSTTRRTAGTSTTTARTRRTRRCRRRRSPSPSGDTGQPTRATGSPSTTGSRTT